MNPVRWRMHSPIASFVLAWTVTSSHAWAQPEVPAATAIEATGDTTSAAVATTPDKVDVRPVAPDEDIAERLRRILEATEWFAEVQVKVDEGVVFLHGSAQTAEVKTWAGSLARRTEGVVAVVNQMEVDKPPITDFSPALEGLRELWRDLIGAIPFAVFGLVIFALSFVAARFTALGTRRVLRHRVATPLLREVFARSAGFLVIVVGLYIVLKVAGLTRLALTVLGGTGIIGLVIGIAFRDITENFLASIFLSMQRPFLIGDLIEISGVVGYVQRLTVRTTVLMTVSGNQVAIPNATVYKSTIRNFSSNKNRREDFTVGIGYDDPIPHAQEVALKVLREHPAVLKDPEPWALVESLGSATVVLRIYFWLDGSEHSWLKVKSSVIRITKRAFQDAGISMPDEAREVVFPAGIPIRMLAAGADASGADPAAARSDERIDQPASPTTVPTAAEPVATRAEGGLNSEAGEIKDQAKHSRPIEGADLLDPVVEGRDS
jgi:small conductance mechanosensitive channel